MEIHCSTAFMIITKNFTLLMHKQYSVNQTRKQSQCYNNNFFSKYVKLASKDKRCHKAFALPKITSIVSRPSTVFPKLAWQTQWELQFPLTELTSSRINLKELPLPMAMNNIFWIIFWFSKFSKAHHKCRPKKLQNHSYPKKVIQSGGGVTRSNHPV